MSTTFQYMGFPVEVKDKNLAEAIADVVEGGSYSLRAIEHAAPRMMAGLEVELRTWTDRGVVPDRMEVVEGKVKSYGDGDPRRAKKGTQLGS